MKVRFQADKDLNNYIVQGVLRRETQIDFLSATVAGLDGLSDSEVLQLTALSGRVLVSHDISTMPRHFAKFIEHNDSPGALVIAQGTQIGVAIEALLLVWQNSEAHEWRNRLCLIPSLATLVARPSPD